MRLDLRINLVAPQNRDGLEGSPGTTRSVVEELLLELGIPHRTTPVAEATLRAADEIWLAAATREITSVTRLDGQPVGSGAPGPVWQRTWRAFQDLIRRLAGTPW